MAVAWPRGAVAEPPLPTDPFTLGVASGDPVPAAVVIWTRLAPDPLNGGGMPAAPITVEWQVSSDELFATIVRSGSVQALPEHAHSVHVDVGGLEPATTYWYRFRAGGFMSPVARTRTAPAASSTLPMARFGFASCQNWQDGFYTAHAHLDEEPLDLVFFLGDYIYEGGVGSGVRPHNSPEPTTLEAYRNRYALYKGDPNLQASHAAFPWIVVWDDHEVENNYAGIHDENGTDQATFLARRSAAYKAWWEHQPVRLAAPTGSDLLIYRSFSWGRLASFFALDTRQYRDPQVCMTTGDIGVACPDMFDPDRTMLGEDQERWLRAGLSGSDSTWNVLAQQVVFTSMPLGTAYNQDQWDGYPGPRQRIVDFLAGTGVINPLIITGDIHAAGVGVVHQAGEDPDSPRVATELVTTSISSGFGDEELVAAGEAIIGALPWVEYVNARDRGYATVELTSEQATASYRVVSTVAETSATVRTDFTHVVPAAVKNGQPGSTTPVDPSIATVNSGNRPVVAIPRFTG